MARCYGAFSSLGGDYSLEIFSRLPEGKTVADLNPELREACGDDNTVRMYMSFDKYEPGDTIDRFTLLCDGARILDESFVEQGLSLRREMWRTTEQQN